MLSTLISMLAPPLCLACAADAGRAEPLCRECRAALFGARPSGGPAGCWAAFAYDGPAGALVRSLKFGGRVAVADVMAAQLTLRAPDGLLEGVLVPVPIHPRHRRRRGLAHAELLAAAVGRRSGLEVAECLGREGDPRPQVGRGRRQRIAGVAGAIGVRAGTAVPRRALVIDDVVTTGATIAACRQALRSAGAERVAGVAYARTSGV